MTSNFNIVSYKDDSNTGIYEAANGRMKFCWRGRDLGFVPSVVARGVHNLIGHWKEYQKLNRVANILLKRKVW